MKNTYKYFYFHGKRGVWMLKDIKCFVLDMDGTFYLGYTLIDGSLEFIETVEAQGKDFLFLTNNSSRSGEYYVEKLRNMDCNVERNKIFTSGEATAIYLSRERKDERVYVLGTEFLKEELMEYDITVVEDDPDLVVVGFDTTLTYDKLSKTCTYIRNGVPFIATHPDYNCPTEDGMIPDIGAILAFIKASTDKDPELIVGKPHGEIVESLLEKTGCTKDEIAIVGDRLYTDIATGVNHGILSILVLTGETSLEDVEASPIKPHMIFDSLKTISDELKNISIE